MMNPAAYIAIMMLILFECSAQNSRKVYESETLLIEQLGKNTYLHVSWLQTETFGRVACNGMVVTADGEAFIADTPVNEAVSEELIGWIENSLKCKPIGIAATHFHTDCLGGLTAFHRLRVPSYANNKTLDLAGAAAVAPLPQNGFDGYLEIEVGSQQVFLEFPGEGHTKDNIVCYFPADDVLFGGCLIKASGAGKGNLEDANQDDWAATVEAVQRKYGDAAVVIPGHGRPGGQELLTYTRGLFKTP